MQTPTDIATHIADKIGTLEAPDPRNLIAVAGPPASGKSTVAEVLCDILNARGTPTGLVAMDGFHLANPILDARGLRARKGAPETFDLAGFSHLLERLSGGGDVIAPSFDRTIDASIGSSVEIPAAATTVIVEGNYLALNEPGWSDLKRHWTLSIFLETDISVLEERLMDRWRTHGHTEDEARRKVHANDLPNAKRVLANSTLQDLTLQV